MKSHFSCLKISLFVWMCFSLPVSLCSQTYYYFWIQFKDKNNSPYALSKPSDYLSEKSIARRALYGISCDSTDLPVNPAYVNGVVSAGATVHSKSKWLNGVTVKVQDSTLISVVRKLPYVKTAKYSGKITASTSKAKSATTSSDVDYGKALSQINMLNGRYFHNDGYRGKGIVIGVLDAGYNNVNVNSCFDSLRLQGRLLGTKDVIGSSSGIYAEDAHGAYVLSAMAGNINGQYLGTAPDASYWLIRTEYSQSEYRVETDFWASGVEFADSVGVDMINSSLGYFTFDDTSMNFLYADLNGKVSHASIAATLAASKGILVVVSAGNDGTTSKHYVGSPADADHVITVGSVQTDSLASAFSSYGPTYDGRIKPNLCAIGTSSSLVSTSGAIITGNGTSFASPILCGVAACMLQKYRSTYANPDLELFRNALNRSGHLFLSPTSQMGYGIPNFSKAWNILNGLLSENEEVTAAPENGLLYRNDDKSLRLRAGMPLVTKCQVEIYSSEGKLLQVSIISPETDVVYLKKTSPGLYFALCKAKNFISKTRFIVH